MIHPQYVLVDVEGAIHVMHVVMEEIVGGFDGHDRLERRGLTHGDLNRVEAAPGLAPHADAAV